MMKFTFVRHLIQAGILVLFVLGNLGIFKFLEGNLSGSKLLGVLHLNDPFAALQLFLAGLALSTTAVIGAIIVLVFYALIAPRAFCGWVCPVNIVTDLANYIRTKIGITKNLASFSPKARYYLLVLSLVLSVIFHIAAFESVSYIGALTRSVVYLGGSFFAIFVAILLVDIFIQKRFICGHLCPLGAFWAVVSKFSLIRIKYSLDKCKKCNECLRVCPETSTLNMVGKSDGLVSSECISCGRCVEICNDDALNFTILNFGDKK